MLLASGHPAVKAVVPMFSPFDVYDEIGFPGGVLSSWYVKEWAEVNELLDANRPPVDSWFEKLAARGVRPVDGPEGRTKLALAVADRNGNVDVSEEASFVTFRDDASPSIRTLDDMSPHASRARAAATSIPIYGYSGWFDGAYAHAAIRRFMTDDNPLSRIRIGPWDHGGGRHRSPFAPAASTFDHRGEVLRFLDAHVRGIDTGILEEPRVRYFVMGAEEWRSSEGWPPAGNEPAPRQIFSLASRSTGPAFLRGGPAW
jgi:putative CocE/NonD family hydrolase